MDQRRLALFYAAIAAMALPALPALPAQAGLQDDVPSCYTANRITPADHLSYSRLIYVLIDQTVGWNPELEQAILDNLNSNLSPGTKFVIAEFSAYAQGRYLNVIHTGIIENPMPETQIDSTPIAATKMFNACLAGQRPYATAMADRSLQSALQASSSTLGHSDIMLALQSVSNALATDPARRKLLLLASDGLENSAVTSFYRHGSLRDIDPKTELQHAADAALLGNFGGSKVFVIGGALSGSPSDSNEYRSPEILENLAKFWQLYFEKSNATLVEFGEPDLLQPVAF
jgi:hypothetical protein